MIATEHPVGVVAAFGGQTAIKLTKALQQAGVRILGTSADAIDLAEDRERFDDRHGEASHQAPAGLHGNDLPRRLWRQPIAWAIPYWCAPPTCWADRT